MNMQQARQVGESLCMRTDGRHELIARFRLYLHRFLSLNLAMHHWVSHSTARLLDIISISHRHQPFPYPPLSPHDRSADHGLCHRLRHHRWRTIPSGHCTLKMVIQSTSTLSVSPELKLICSGRADAHDAELKKEKEGYAF